MAGHIMLPSYTRAMNPDIKDDDIMPATLSKELLTDLLKAKWASTAWCSQTPAIWWAYPAHEAQRA